MTFIIGILSFCITCLFAQTKRDSVTKVLAKNELSPSSTWDILAPFLSDEAASWNPQNIDYADTLLQIAKEYFPARLSQAYAILGELHLNGESLDKSLVAFQKGLDHLHQSNDSSLGLAINRGIGNIFYIQEQYDKARDYFYLTLRNSKVLGDSLYEALSHLSISNTFVGQNNLDSSTYHLYRAEELAEEAQLKKQLTVIYNNIIFLEDEKGNFEYARNYIYKLLNLAAETNDRNTLMLGYGNLGYSYGRFDNKFDSAVYYLKLGLEYFDPQFSEKDDKPQFFKAIADNYISLGLADSALVYFQKYVKLHDSIQLKKFNESVRDIEAKYQTEEKEKQLIQAKLETERQRNLLRITIGSATAVIALLFGVFQFFRNRQRLRRKEAELLLEAEKAQAQQLLELDQLKSNFFTNISHEFRTPLTLILGPSEQMKQKGFKGDVQESASLINRHARRLRDLINQLLDLSKLESGQLQMNFEPGDIYQFSRQLVGSFESWAKQKKITYQFQIPNNPLWVLYDRDKYEKILSNLISNAIKHTPEGGDVKILFGNEVLKPITTFYCEIENSGRGIPKAEHDKIFQRFYQNNSGSRGVASSGIGLALTKELIQFLGGTISLKSDAEKSTQFQFNIPLKLTKIHLDDSVRHNTSNSLSDDAKSDLLLLNPNENKKNLKTTFNSDSPIVLVVEDNIDVRRYLIDQIKDQYQILEAVNGQQGLEIAQVNIPDLIITDLMMPRMTGNEMTVRLKMDERTSHIPVIMLTAKADQKAKIEGLETGADDYLTKPFHTLELKTRIKNLIAQRMLLKARFSKGGINLNPKEIAVNSVDEQFLNRLLEFLEIEIDNEHLSVEDLAGMIGMSRSQLHRKLTALTDKAPSAFIRTFRIQRAQQLLLKKAGNTSEIAFMVGFSSLSYFSKCFKEEYGKSPSEILKNR